MSRRVSRCVAWGFLTGILLPTVRGLPVQPPAQPSSPNVGIFYEGPDLPLAEGYLGAHYVKNLLGHFGLRGELVKVTEYRSGQLSHYRAAFYIGSVAKTMLPEVFLNDVRSSVQPICWLGQHIDQLLAGSKFQARFGLRFVGFQGNRSAWRIDYKDTLFPKDNFNLTVVAPISRRQFEVRATAVQGDNVRVPYAGRKGRFWYFADTPFGGAQEGNRYLVFCDLLHDILEIDHAPQTHALARMEDVSAEANVRVALLTVSIEQRPALRGIECDAAAHEWRSRIVDMSGSTQLYTPGLLSLLRGAI